MAGGSSKVPGLLEALRQEFSLPVEILNPFPENRASDGRYGNGTDRRQRRPIGGGSRFGLEEL